MSPLPCHRMLTKSPLIQAASRLKILLIIILFIQLVPHFNQNEAHASSFSTITLRVGISADFPPMESIENGQIVGLDIDLMNAIAGRMGAQVTYSNIPFEQLFSSLENDTVDVVISTVSITAERETLFDFTLPYATFINNDQIAIVVKKGNDAIRRQINEALWQLRADGTLQANVQAMQPELNALQPQMPIWPEIVAGSETSLEYGPGTVSIVIPDGAVAQTTILTYQPMDPVDPNGSFFFAGRSFQLDGFQNGTFIDGLVFDEAIKVTISYDDSKLTESEEQALLLRVWDEPTSQWKDAATTCTPVSTYQRNLSENWLSVDICHLSWFALFSSEKTLLPAIYR